MNEENLQERFSAIRAFEWDEKKRQQNLTKHGIDFDDARAMFDGPMIVKQSNRGTETRYLVFGLIEDLEAAVVCAIRGDRCRIISARRAKTDERKRFHSSVKRDPAAG